MHGKSSKNRLLAALPEQEYKILKPQLITVQLQAGEILYEPNQVITHAYFPVDAVISLISSTEEGETVEIVMIGSEGVAGVDVLLGQSRILHRATVQSAGKAEKVEVSVLQELFFSGGVTHTLILRYIHTVLAQLAQSAICNRFHNLEERIARWLLCSVDRIGSTIFPYTQDLLASILGTRRVSVTLVLGNMERSGIISTGRGTMKINSRKRLEALACECYSITRREIDGLLADLIRNRTN